jgi:hypothetical protein
VVRRPTGATRDETVQARVAERDAERGLRGT